MAELKSIVINQHNKAFNKKQPLTQPAAVSSLAYASERENKMTKGGGTHHLKVVLVRLLFLSP